MSDDAPGSPPDRLFSEPQPKGDPFRFDERVATVFPDMIARSVPGYADVLAALTPLARRVVQPHTNVYDLGCSLGAATLAVLKGIECDDVHVHAIDNSPAMIERARERLEAFRYRGHVAVTPSDVLDVPLQTASLVLLNYTLQFIPVDRRSDLCQRIHDALVRGGVLVLSEKITFPDKTAAVLLSSLHEEFKRVQGYSELEISQKRSALEGVLIPEQLEMHIRRLREVGFSTVTTWFQHYNFVSLLAIKT